MTVAHDRNPGRRRPVTFLEGVGAVPGRERDSAEILGDLGDSDTAQDRLLSVIHSPALELS